jgi:metallo-beta-lactamase class B
MSLSRAHLSTAVLAVVAALAATAAAPAADPARWNEPVEPLRIIGPVHFVGTNELAAFLVTTPEGDVLIDGGLPDSAPLIEQSIRKLGFDPRRITDASFRFEPVKVDRTLRDRDTVSLGGITLTARKTPGHTPGSTTWLTSVEAGGRRYEVVFAASTGINPGTRFLDRPSYPGIAADYAHAFEVLESLRPDVFLGGHTGFFDLEGKRGRLGRAGPVNPFVDPEGFRAHVASRKRAFEEQLARERAGSGPGR